jgi:hypothetical protein
MKLLLSEYLRGLKERDELDVILPRLLLSMKLIPLSRTQRGTRQFGVDLAAVGPDPQDGATKLFLFVLKRGDLGRSDWDGEPQSVRRSVNEIFDTYVHMCVRARHRDLQKVIVVATTGDMKEEIAGNFAGLTKQYEQAAEIRFWSADTLASLIEKYMLSHELFSNEYQQPLRRALALAGEPAYDRHDLHQIFGAVLQLDVEGTARGARKRASELLRALSTLELCVSIFNHWASSQQNTKQALLGTERAVLWTWCRLRNEPAIRQRNSKLARAFELLVNRYRSTADEFAEKLKPYYETSDSLSVGVADGEIVSMRVFDQIGILATAALVAAGFDQSSPSPSRERFVDALEAVIRGHKISGSPILDEYCIEIDLAMLLLCQSGRVELVSAWLSELVDRVSYAFRVNRFFPAYSVEELLDGRAEEDIAPENGYSLSSWMIACLADWCVMLGEENLYNLLKHSMKNHFSHVCPQRWHPEAERIGRFYFEKCWFDDGDVEVLIDLLPSFQHYAHRIEELRNSPAFEDGETDSLLTAVASRHLRNPVPPIWLYKQVARALASPC